jgi:hypothetical protein
LVYIRRKSKQKYPDLCGLVFVQTWSLKDHQIRGCPDNEPPAKRCKREDDEVEGTYSYELEYYLKDLPAIVFCDDQLTAREQNRAQTLAIEKGYTG